MIGALSNGLSGMLTQQSRVDAYAGKIAGAAVTGLNGAGGSPSAIVSLSGNAPAAGIDDLASSLVGMNESLLLYKANASMVKAADDMLGSLLEARA